MSNAELKARLIQFGIQPSSPRMAVADFVLNTLSHPTADEVKEEVEKRMPSVSTATIYNTLNLFVEKGLLQIVTDPKRDIQRYDCNTHPHFHFYDETTGELLDLDARVLKIQPDLNRLNKEFEISSIDVLLRGKRKTPSPQEEK